MIDTLPSVNSLPVVETLYKNTTIGALAQVIVVNAWDVIDHIYGRNNWEDAGNIFNAWCKENRIQYYGSPRESFDLDEAFELAVQNGNPYLIVEDLS